MPRYLCTHVLAFGVFLTLVLLIDICAASYMLSGATNALSSGSLLFYASLVYSTNCMMRSFRRSVRALRTWRRSQCRAALSQADRRLRTLALLVGQSVLVMIGVFTFEGVQRTVAEGLLLSTGLLAMSFCWYRFLSDAPNGCI